MHIIFGHVRQFKVDHERQFSNINAACSNVCRYQRGGAAFLEIIQRLFALGLRAVAVDGGGFDAVALQLAREFVAVFFHAQEYQHLRHVACAYQIGEQGAFVFCRNFIHLMRYQISGRVAPRDFNRQRITQHLVGETLDVVGKRRRKQQALTLRWNQRNDAFQVRQKAHVEHAVGFVQHQNLHLRQIDGFLLHVIKQPPRRGNEDFHARHQRGLLRFHIHAAIHHRGTQRQMFTVALN